MHLCKCTCLRGHPAAHLQDLDDHLLIVGDVDGLEHLAVLSSAQLTNQLVVLLVAIGTDGETYQSMCEKDREIFSVSACNQFNEWAAAECSCHWHTTLPWGLNWRQEVVPVNSLNRDGGTVEVQWRTVADSAEQQGGGLEHWEPVLSVSSHPHSYMYNNRHPSVTLSSSIRHTQARRVPLSALVRNNMHVIRAIYSKQKCPHFQLGTWAS